MEHDKWSKLRRTLLKEYAPLQWRPALVSEWLNSLTQGNNPSSLYIANAGHWSTIITITSRKITAFYIYHCCVCVRVCV